MDDLVEFIEARLEADAAEIALHPDGEDDWPSEVLLATSEQNYPCAPILQIHKHRALREVAHKREILADHAWWIERPAETDAQLHARCAHPDWEYATTEGRRKAWDDADEPPVDDDGQPDHTWERNVDAGRDGWERFDHTEESYWRRRLSPEKAAEKRRAPLALLRIAEIYSDHPAYQESWRPDGQAMS